MTNPSLLAPVTWLVPLTLCLAAEAKPRVTTSQVATPLDEYVTAKDPSFRWEVVRRSESRGIRSLLIDLTSQQWRSADEVSRPEWEHWLTVVIPDGDVRSTALLSVKGGVNQSKPPATNTKRLVRLAQATQTVVAELWMIPNQPLRIRGGEDPEANQFEDNLIVASWVRCLETNDPTWIAQLPMAKSVVAGMDAVQQALAAEPDAPTVEKFTVTGASKRGFTSWLAAAADDRVAAVAPLVIDLLNIEPSMKHHHACYGFYSKALRAYERAGIADQLNSPGVARILAVADPYRYRERLTMPKCVINSAGDEYFLPDSSRYYFDDLVGEKHLSYTPNTGHGLSGSNAYDTLIAFHASVAHGLERPTVTWTGNHSAAAHTVTCSAKPTEAILWQAVNPKARDFRKSEIGEAYRPTKLAPDDDGSYRIPIEAPSEGFSATFARFAFDLGVGFPFRVSTPVWVAPDVEPFAQTE